MIRRNFLTIVSSNKRVAFTPYALHSKISAYKIPQSITFTAATGSVKNGMKTINKDPADTITPIIWSGKCAIEMSNPKADNFALFFSQQDKKVSEKVN